MEQNGWTLYIQVIQALPSHDGTVQREVSALIGEDDCRIQGDVMLLIVIRISTNMTRISTNF